MDGLDRRRLLGLFAGLGATSLTGALGACGAAPAADDLSPIRIGLLVPLSGANRNIGIDMQDGFSLYLAQHGHLLGGHKVEPVIEDEGESPEAGVAALQRIYDKQPLAVIGVSSAQILGALREPAEKAQIPLLATHGSPAHMPSSVYVWRTAFVNDEPGMAIGGYLKRRIMDKIGLIGLHGTAEGDILSGFSAAFGSGALEPVTVAETAKPTAAHFASAVNQLAASNAAAIFSALPTSYTVAFMDALKANSKLRDKRIYAPGPVSEGVALGELGNQAVGLLTALPYSADLDNGVNHTFSSSYQSTYLRTPSSFAVSAFDAAAVLDRAVGLASNGLLSPQRLNAEIANVGQIVSPRGNWQFNQERHPQQKWYLREVRNDGPVLSNVLVSDLATLG
jgi:branched-chain amino acid transport system substrate-binding protein